MAWLSDQQRDRYSWRLVYTYGYMELGRFSIYFEHGWQIAYIGRWRHGFWPKVLVCGSLILFYFLVLYNLPRNKTGLGGTGCVVG